ncbi:beta strand repeat-containing protein [Anatilimnocola floriformis]|uniref:beta strand repeat-containing protein n=1 Tax=Anatilimnocola floriformis TaxID=2948575 RepID=UPI0020C4A178|nr:Ig-like domain-containing protein [Anatilimnocola floriformis]
MAAFTEGNLVIYRVGSTGANLTNNGSPVFLDEYSPTGTLVQSVALPTTASGGNNQLVASGLIPDEGQLTRSQDGRYLMLGGYGADLNGSAVLTNSATPRVIGRVDGAGNVNTTTAISSLAATSVIRSVASTNGVDIWYGGFGMGNQYTTLGSTSTVAISSSPTIRRATVIYDNQLYMTTEGGNGRYGVSAVGTGLPTTPIAGLPTLLSGLPGQGAPDAMLTPNAFFFADISATEPGADVLYVANDDANGLRKFSKVGGTWVANGSLGVDADDYRGLIGTVNGSTVTLFATRKGGNTATGGGELVSIVDASGYNTTISGAPTILATAATHTAFRGVALAPTLPPNQPPVNTVPVAALGTEDTPLPFTGLNAISVSDADAGTNNLTFTISVTAAALGLFSASSNGGTAVVGTSNGGATLTITGPQLEINKALQTLVFTPGADRNLSAEGPILATVTTSDGSAQDIDTFNINLNEINDPPVAVADLLGELGVQGGGPITIPIATLLANDSKGAANESSQTLTLTGASNPVGGTVAIVGSNVVFTPTANFSGNASFSYTIQDDGQNAGMPSPQSGTGTASFTIGDINDAPSFVIGANQLVSENAPAQTVTGWATAISAGPNETAQTVTFQVTTNTNSALFTAGGQPAVSSNGTLTYTPAPGVNGTATITLVAKDNGGTANGGVDTSAPQSFVITVTAAPVNLQPTINAVSNLTILEGAPLQTINLSGITDGGDVPSQALTVTASSSNNSLVPIAVNYTSPNSTGTLTFTSPVNGNGSSTITVNVRDTGLDLIANNADDGIRTITFTVNVTAVNDVPTFVIGPNQTVNEDAAAQSIAAFATGITTGANNETSQALTFNVSNDNPGLFSAGPAISANGTLTYTPAANAFGNATITVTLSDNGGTANGGVDTTAPQSFTITVNSVNDAPTIALAGNQTIAITAPAQSIPNFASVVSVGPANEVGQTVTYQITGNDNAGLFSVAPAIAADGTLTYTVSGTPGTATITVVGRDSGGTANSGVDTSAPLTFTITVTPVLNALPTINAVSNLTILEGAPLQTINLTGITDGGDAAAQAISVSASSSNTSLVPIAVNYTSPNNTGTLTFTSPVNGNGVSTITVTVRDSGLDLIPNNADDGITTRTFTVTVTAVNDQPTFTAAAPPVVNEDAPAQSVTGFITSFSAGPNNENTQAVSAYLVANVSNAALFAVAPAVSPTGTLTYTLAPNANGSSTFELRVRDNGGTDNGGLDTSNPQTFTITVNPVNDAPSFVAGPNISRPNGSPAQTIPNWATAISAGPANEVGQTVAFNVTANTNPGLFSVAPAVSSAGTLTFTPTTGAQGIATITLVAQDNGGTANGGSDTSSPRTFTITILPNQPPVANDSTIPTLINTPVSRTLSATDPDGPALTFSIGSNPNLGTITAFDPMTGAFTYTPLPGATGLDLFSFTVSDGLNSDDGLVRITIQGTQPVVTPSNGDLLVIGTPDPDIIIISPVSAGIVQVRTDRGSAFYPISVQLIVNAGEGNDYVIATNLQVPVTLDLGEGDDYASGGLQNDLIIGGAGSDQINASGGDNVVWGDTLGEQDLNTGGNDVLSSLGGNDVMYGGGGNDQLFPGAGNDYVHAGQGDDVVSAGAGNDRVFGSGGNDQLYGDEGDDVLVGGSGSDTLVGRTGDDLLIGGVGSDALNGDEGSDLLIAGDVTISGSTLVGDASDLALMALLAAWTPAHPAGVATSVVVGNDGAVDSLQGYTGDDDFYLSANDAAGDLGLPFMGTDRTYYS